MATNPYQGTLLIQFLAKPNYIPSSDIGNNGPVPEGTINAYGKALWIPDGYPIVTQPYLDSYGRIIMRPLRYLNAPDANTMNVWTAYMLTALQYAISQYGSVNYNIANQVPLWSGPAVVQSYIIAPPSDRWAILTRTTLGSWDPDFGNPIFPQATATDAAFNSGKNFVMSTFTSLANAVVPGLGTQLVNAVNKASKGGIYGVQSLPGAQQVQKQTAAIESSLLPQQNYLLYAAAVVVIIIIILIS